MQVSKDLLSFMPTILITGAAGAIGRLLARSLSRDHALRLTDVRPLDDVPPGAEFRLLDVADLAALREAARGAQAIIHLGGISTEADFDSILQTNIVGTRNVFEAARLEGVERVVFPSSNQVQGFYERSRRVGVEDPLRPSGWYGVSKAFGESVGALYADKFGLRVLAIRIGRYAPLPEDVRGLSIWIGDEDLVQLVRIGLEHPSLHFEIVYGVSDNARGWWDNRRAFELGYRPRLDAEDHRDHAFEAQRSRPPVSEVAARFTGARLTSVDYAGDPQRSGR